MGYQVPTPSAERAEELDVPVPPSEVTAAVEIVDIGPALGTGSDAGGDPASVAADLVAAFRRTGFAVVTGHRVSPALFHVMSEVSTEFFALPLAEKLAVAFPAPEIVRGYEPLPTVDGAGRITNTMESLLINRL